MRVKDAYIRKQTGGFHLILEVKTVLQADAFHGPNNEGVEHIPCGLHPIQHHIIIHIPQQEMPI